MRRVLATAQRRWLTAFLPGIPPTATADAAGG